ncbi:unnamed protein product, partial [Soboliphyme baturini]|uniref:Adhesive plaque matrix protein n=1 Tax=Soboliphyme baturini TaxID=241478 RepID=A0A183IJA4_9BILA
FGYSEEVQIEGFGNRGSRKYKHEEPKYDQEYKHEEPKYDQEYKHEEPKYEQEYKHEEPKYEQEYKHEEPKYEQEYKHEEPKYEQEYKHEEHKYEPHEYEYLRYKRGIPEPHKHEHQNKLGIMGYRDAYLKYGGKFYGGANEYQPVAAKKFGYSQEVQIEGFGNHGSRKYKHEEPKYEREYNHEEPKYEPEYKHEEPKYEPEYKHEEPKYEPHEYEYLRYKRGIPEPHKHEHHQNKLGIIGYRDAYLKYGGKFYGGANEYRPIAAKKFGYSEEVQIEGFGNRRSLKHKHEERKYEPEYKHEERKYEPEYKHEERKYEPEYKHM